MYVYMYMYLYIPSFLNLLPTHLSPTHHLTHLGYHRGDKTIIKKIYKQYMETV